MSGHVEFGVISKFPPSPVKKLYQLKEKESFFKENKKKEVLYTIVPGSHVFINVLLNCLNVTKSSSRLLSRPLCLLKQSGPTRNNKLIL